MGVNAPKSMVLVDSKIISNSSGTTENASLEDLDGQNNGEGALQTQMDSQSEPFSEECSTVISKMFSKDFPY
ncbi:hypothetical protein, partial [Pseudomonas lurida]|uniref:hypothetical protein n=1 Tax=Pseudomonas lurida TaxID=244566 RepID=UPI0034D965CE